MRLLLFSSRCFFLCSGSFLGFRSFSNSYLLSFRSLFAGTACTLRLHFYCLFITLLCSCFVVSFLSLALFKSFCDSLAACGQNHVDRVFCIVIGWDYEVNVAWI